MRRSTQNPLINSDRFFGPVPPSFVTRVEQGTVLAVPGADQVPSARRPVRDIEGVGEYYGEKLREMGIVTIGDLWTAELNKVSSHLDIPETIVRNWRAMGELIDVYGIGPQFAELLVRCGIRSIPQLAQAEPNELLARILLTSAERMVRIQGAPIGYRHVENWIEAARKYDQAA